MSAIAPCTVVCSAFLLCPPLQSQQQQPIPTFRFNSNLVFLDVTVLDKKGHPVVSGLAKEDFTITEDKVPQRIFSFEAPEVHVSGPGIVDEDSAGRAPVTVFVLDQLNSTFEDFAYIRYEVRRFLLAQPAQLPSPAELMVIRNESLDMVQGYTRNRSDLLYALDHLPAALPFKKMNASFFWERFLQSMDVLQQIALQNRGVPGRKNVVWVGHGGPGINLTPLMLPPQTEDELEDYVHSTTNMLVDSRISLFVIYPGLSVQNPNFSLSAMDADAEIGDEGDPFAGEINFGVLVNETGGELFFNRNDVDAEMSRSVDVGNHYYTLTYQPHDIPPNGKFRRIRVSLRDRDLHAVTKAGYYAPNEHSHIPLRQQGMMSLVEAARATIPFSSLGVSVAGIVRHPDTRSLEFTVQLHSRNLNLLPASDGKYATDLILSAVSLDSNRDIKSSRVNSFMVLSKFRDNSKLPEVVSQLKMTLPVPRQTAAVRVVVEDTYGGRLGAAELNRKMIDGAPAASTPEPQAGRRDAHGVLSR